jgi:hypothetical protein
MQKLLDAALLSYGSVLSSDQILCMDTVSLIFFIKCKMKIGASNSAINASYSVRALKIASFNSLSGFDHQAGLSSEKRRVATTSSEKSALSQCHDKKESRSFATGTSNAGVAPLRKRTLSARYGR